MLLLSKLSGVWAIRWKNQEVENEIKKLGQEIKKLQENIEKIEQEKNGYEESIQDILEVAERLEKELQENEIAYATGKQKVLSFEEEIQKIESRLQRFKEEQKRLEEQKEFAYTKLMKSPDGEYTNGIYMFFKTLLPLIESQKITHLAVVLDRSRNTFRREIDPEYKANRSETPYPLKSQFKLLTEILQEMNIPVFSHTEYEADDFAGSLVKKFEKDIPIYLHTKDEDYIQLVSENTKLWMVTSKADDMYKEIGIDKKDINVPSGIFEYTPEYVKHFKGIEPIQIIDAKAIEGDKSDNIKGVKNVGPTSSRPLIAHYGSIEEIYKNIENLSKDEEKELLTFFKENLGIKRSPLKNLLLYKEDAIISKKLATIKTDIEEIQNMDLDSLALNIDNEKMHEIFMNLGMVSLVK